MPLGPFAMLQSVIKAIAIELMTITRQVMARKGFDSTML